MSKIQIRSATIYDAAPLSTLATTVFCDTYGAVIPSDVLQEYIENAFSVEALRVDLSHPSTKYVVACHNETLIGFSKLAPTDVPSGVCSTRAIELVKLYVAKGYHGLGVGAALMERTICEAKALRYDGIWLCVWKNNERAIAFYRKWGFEMVGTTQIFVGHIVFDDLVLERKR